MDNQKLKNCIDACQTVVKEAKSCTTECCKGKPGMEQCEKLCAATTEACNNLITASKTTSILDSLYKKCEEACNACAVECEKHKNLDHCKKCAEACRKCATECKNMLAVAVK
jgi:hypothetical protein